MKPMMKLFPVLALGLLAACGGGSSVTGPDAPLAATASIDGTVDGAATALKVSVLNTGLSTSTDGAGHFALQGVPVGLVTLRFEGPGTDARLEVSGLVAGQTLSVHVSVSGSEASLRPSGGPSPSPSPSPSPEDERETALRGRIESISAPSLKVAGKDVVTDNNTRFRRSGQTIAFADLKVGMTVEVEGRSQADGSILAKSVTVEDDQPENEVEVRFTGTIQALSSPTLKVSGQTVVTDDSTRITRRGDDIAFSSLKVGNKVEVEGTQRADGSVLAKKISLED